MPDIAEVTTDCHWTKLALCAGHPEKACWFPEDHHTASRAIAICRVCPVRDDCLSFAIKTGQSEGVWGGTTPHQRRRMVRSGVRP